MPEAVGLTDESSLSTTQASSSGRSDVVTPLEDVNPNRTREPSLRDLYAFPQGSVSANASSFPAIDGPRPFSTPKEFRSLQSSTMSLSSSWQTPHEIPDCSIASTQNVTQTTPSSSRSNKSWGLSLSDLPPSRRLESSDSTMRGGHEESFPDQISTVKQPTIVLPEMMSAKCESKQAAQSANLDPKQPIHDSEKEKKTAQTQMSETGSLACMHSEKRCTQKAKDCEDTLYSPNSASSASNPTVCSGSYCPACHRNWNQYLVKGYQISKKKMVQERETQTSKSLETMKPVDQGFNDSDFWKKILYDRTRKKNQENPLHSVTIQVEEAFYPDTLSTTKTRPFPNLRRHLELRRHQDESARMIKSTRTKTTKLWPNYIRYLCLYDPRIKNNPRFDREIWKNFRDFILEPLDLCQSELEECHKRFGDSLTFSNISSYLHQIKNEGERMKRIAQKTRKLGFYGAMKSPMSAGRTTNQFQSKAPKWRNPTTDSTSSRTLENVSTLQLSKGPSPMEAGDRSFRGWTPRNHGRGRVARDVSRHGTESAPTSPLTTTNLIRSLTKPKLTPRSNKADRLRSEAIHAQIKKKLFESP